MPTCLSWSYDFSNKITAELKKTGALFSTTKNKNGSKSTLKLSLLSNTHAKMFGEKKPLEGAVQTALEVERRHCAPRIEIHRKKFIQEVLQSSVTFKKLLLQIHACLVNFC